MKIGILGSGDVGRMLASGFLNEGHEVMLGTRDTSKDEVVKWNNKNVKGQIGTFADTGKLGEVLILAAKGTVIGEVIKQTGIANFRNKVVIDATNPIADAPPQNGVLKFFTNLDESLMERIQKQIPEAKVVKAFNSIGSPFMYKPKFPDGTPTMFICGNDESAKKTVKDILTKFGWETVDMGKVESARAIEPLSMLWCIPGFLRNEWTHAFKLLKV